MEYLIKGMQIDKIQIFSCKNLFIPGYFVCDKCSSKGEWNILEKFLLLIKLTKTNDMQKELETLRNAIKVQENYVSKWDNIIKSNQQIADLSSELYEKVLKTFSLPVR